MKKQKPTTKTKEQLFEERIYCSFHEGDVNYVSPEQHALLLEVIEFLTFENVKKYFIDFYINKIPCCGRTLYVYLTKVVTNPNLSHMTHFKHKGKNIHVLEFYRQAMNSERRRNNDIFGRSVMIQIRCSQSEWIPIKLCQIMLCYMIDQMHLFDYIDQFLPQINNIMINDELKKNEKKIVRSRLSKQNMVSHDTVEFHMSDQNQWKINLDNTSFTNHVETQSGIDFYMS